MTYIAHTVFISYHHIKDKEYANQLKEFYGSENTFIDRSPSEEIDSDDDDYILSEIRTKYLKNSSVTMVLIGEETWSRKWVDWEIYSSLRPYGDRTVNGLIGVLLPNAKTLPPRFEANYKIEQSQGLFITTSKQMGYAILVNWNDIVPPNPIWELLLGPFLSSEMKQKKNTMSQWIERAFLNREKKDLLDNTLPRYKENKIISKQGSNSLWW